MGDSVELELAGSMFSPSLLLDDMQSFAQHDYGDSADGHAPLSEDEWANLFLTLGSSDDSSPYAHEMDFAPMSTIISTAPDSIGAPTFPFAFSSTLPSSPESGAESSPQDSPQTSPYNDFLFTLPTNMKEEIQSPSSTLPSIEPFPPRSPIFEQQYGMQLGNIGQPSVEMDVVQQGKAASSYERHLGQPLARLQPALSPNAGKVPAEGSAAEDDDDNASKKRRRTAVRSEIAAAASGVVLPRDTLLKLSSAEMEAYLQTLKSSRQLTHDEEKLLKKQLRLIKNREYAQESRKKKKSAHQELEGELTSLRTQNSELRTQNSSLQSEVVLLNSKLAAVTAENTRLRSALRQMQHFHLQTKKNGNNKRRRDDDTASPSSPSSWFSLGLGSASVQSPKTVAGGVCLLGLAIFALSFLLQGPGMFVGSPPDMRSPTARVILQEEGTTYFSRFTLTGPFGATTFASFFSSSSQSTRRTDQEGEEDDPKRPGASGEGEGVAKCGYDNMCYLYADKSHHVKTATRDPAGYRPQNHHQQQAEDEDNRPQQQQQRQNLTHHAIPIPVH